MNTKDFDKIVAARMAWCNKTLCAKGNEYARDGDRLWNFKAAGRKRNCHPAQALAGMKVKHDVSVDDIIDGLAKGIVPPKELVAEKIGDSINYLLLLEGLIEEARANQPATEPWQTAVSEQDTRRREQVAHGVGYIIPQMEDGDDDPGVVKLEAGRNKKVAGGPEMSPGGGEAIADGCSRGDAWSWKMEYCKTHGLTPADAENWSRAERAFTRDVKADFEGVSFVLDAEPIEPGRIYCAPDRTSRATLPDECLGALCGRVRG